MTAADHLQSSEAAAVEAVSGRGCGTKGAGQSVNKNLTLFFGVHSLLFLFSFDGANSAKRINSDAESSKKLPQNL